MLKIISVAVVCLWMIMPTIVVSDNKVILENVIEAMKDKSDSPVQGRGIAIMTEGNKKRLIDFRFMNRLTRSDSYSLSESGEKGKLDAVWAVGSKNAINYSATNNSGTIDSVPSSGFHKKIGYDFQPETFDSILSKSSSEAIKAFAEAPPDSVSVKKEGEDILHITQKVIGGTRDEEFNIWLDINKNYRIVQWELNQRSKDLDDKVQNWHVCQKIEWKKYKGKWYPNTASYLNEGEMLFIENGKNIKKPFKNNSDFQIEEFTPDAGLKEEDFTLGKIATNGAHIIDRIIGVEYEYGVPPISEDDLVKGISKAEAYQVTTETQKVSEKKIDSHSETDSNNLNTSVQTKSYFLKNAMVIVLASLALIVFIFVIYKYSSKH